MKVSVVIPAFNEEKIIADSLRAIAEASRAFQERGWECETIVANNNSTDRTCQIAREHGATVVFEPVNQISRARNAGGNHASGDWLVFVDADSFPTGALFSETADAIQSGRVIGGGTGVRMESEEPIWNFLTALWNRVSRLRRWAAGSYVFCERSAFKEAGGFSLDLYASEEIDFSKKLKKIGRRQKRQFVILKTPMLTSNRKTHLYTRAELLRFLRKAIFSPRRVTGNREACHIWYDGRR